LHSPIDKIPQQIQHAIRHSELVRIYRDQLIDIDIQGYILDSSGELVLVQNVNDGVHMDGYTICRISDFTEIETNFPHYGFIERALNLRGEHRVTPQGIDLTSIETGMKSAAERAPITGVGIEAIDPDLFFVGRPKEFKAKTAIYECLDPDAVWYGDERIRLADVTRVDFLDAYLDAIALVAGIAQ
jgi:hypothetical protein